LSYQRTGEGSSFSAAAEPTKEHAHGQDHREESQDREGEEGGSEEDAGEQEGALPVTRTLNQLTERAGCLSGEIKAAKTALTECETAEAEQERLAGIARQATERARERLDALVAEREQVAEEAKQAILAKGETLATPHCPNHGRGISSGPSGYVCDECGGDYELQPPPANFTSHYTEAPNGADRGVNEAFEQATNPQ
jgi:hypothetical protein